MKSAILMILLALASTLSHEAQAAANDTTTVLFFGDSITAGYGVGEDYAFPSVIEDKIDSLDWNVEVINAGLSGETSAGGLRRIDWLMRRPVDVLVLELGANDGLRGIDPASTRENLQQIMDKVKAKNPGVKIILAGMQVPPNLGQDYTQQFKDIYPELARQNDAKLIPFVLDGVAGKPALNQADGIHPTAEGHRIVAQNVWEVLKPVLKQLRSGKSG